MTERYETYSEADTAALAVTLAANAEKGQVICLYGDLGVGKTAFVRAYAEALGVLPSEVKSPTFSIVNVYSGIMPIYHFDTYRLINADELSETGYEDYFYDDGVCLIEWADMIEELLPKQVTKITINKNIKLGENYREIIISS